MGVLGKALENGASKESQIEAQLKSIESAIDGLRGKTKSLSDRLQPILRLSCPSPECEQATEDALVPVAEKLRGISKAIADEEDLLSDVLDRLEI